MNIEDLTLKQARQLAAMFGQASGGEPLAAVAGKDCIIRSHMSGVWAGRVEGVCGDSVTLAPGARRAWQWSGAGSCSGLATTGPTGGKWPAPQHGHTVVLGVVEAIEATQAAMDAIAAMPIWSGR